MIDALNPEFISLYFQHNRQDYVKALRFYLRKQHIINLWRVPLILLMAVAVAMLTWMMGRLTLINTAVLVFGLVVLLIDGVRYVRMPGQIFDREQDLQAPMSYRFSKEDFTLQLPHCAATFAWDIKAIWFTKTHCFLLHTEGDYRILPRSAFDCPEDETLLLSFAQEANPVLVVHRWG